MTASLQGLVQLTKDYQEKLKAESKVAVQAAVEELVSQLPPEYAGIGWVQYTPYFNDGDPCHFSMHGLNLLIEGEEPPEGEYFDYTWYINGNDYGALDGWSIGQEYEGWGADRTLKENLPWQTAFRELSKGLQEIQDGLLFAFGDHVRVAILRDGTVDVEEYDHE